MTSSSGLDAMNEASDERAAGLLAACNASPGWVAQVLAHRPYRDIASLLDTGERVARALSWTEVCRALDAHPRIGDRATGDSTEAEWSRREQSSVATSDAGTQDALRRAATRRTNSGSGTSFSSAPMAARPTRWWPNCTDASATTTSVSAPR